MTEERKVARQVAISLAARTYLVIGLAAATILGICLTERNAGLWGVLPTLVAAAGIAFRWVNAPVFVLLGVATSMLVTQPFMQSRSYVADIVLAISIVAYVLAQYRLCSLTIALFPADPRRILTRAPVPERRGLPPLIEVLMALTIVPYLIYLAFRSPQAKAKLPTSERRTATELPSDEIPWALLSVIVSATSALAIWLATDQRPAPLRTRPAQWQLGLIFWILVTPIVLTTIIISYRHWRQAEPMEARLMLADDLWRQTRREQRRVARWASWARKKSEVRA